VHRLELLPWCRRLVCEGGDATGFGEKRGLAGFEGFAAGGGITGGVAHFQGHGIKGRGLGLEDRVFDAGGAIEPEVLGVFAENLVIEGVDAFDELVGLVFGEGILGDGFIEDDFVLVMVEGGANGGGNDFVEGLAGGGSGGVEDGAFGAGCAGLGTAAGRFCREFLRATALPPRWSAWP